MAVLMESAIFGSFLLKGQNMDFSEIRINMRVKKSRDLFGCHDV